MSTVAETLRAELAPLRDGAIRPFDAHAHTGVDIDGSSRTSEEHLRELEAVDGRSVIFPLCVATGYRSENRRVVEECGRDPDRLVPFARLDPRVSGAVDAEDAIAAGARGFKLHPRAEDFRLDHPNVEGIFKVAAIVRAPVLIHAGAGVGSLGESLVTLARSYPTAPMILAHAGVSDLGWLWREVPSLPSIHFDTSWLVPADLLALFALVPPGRILFGSDAPYMDFELLLALTLRCARAAGLSDESIELVMGGQLERLLAGEGGLEAGPAPGAPDVAPGPREARLASLLSAVGGCMLGGGDPSRPLELAALAAVEDSASDPRPVIRELIGEAIDGVDPVRATVLALTLSMTPGLARETAVL